MALSTLTTNQSHNCGVYNNNLNGEINPPYLLNSPTYGGNEDDPKPSTRPSSVFKASPLSLGGDNGDVDNSYDPYNIREVTPRSHEPAKIHDDQILVEELNWVVDRQIIINVVTAKTH